MRKHKPLKDGFDSAFGGNNKPLKDGFMSAFGGKNRPLKTGLEGIMKKGVLKKGQSTAMGNELKGDIPDFDLGYAKKSKKFGFGL